MTEEILLEKIQQSEYNNQRYREMLDEEIVWCWDYDLNSDEWEWYEDKWEMYDELWRWECEDVVLKTIMEDLKIPEEYTDSKGVTQQSLTFIKEYLKS